MADRTVKVAIIGDASSLQRALRQSEGALAGFQNRMTAAGQRLRSAGSALTLGVTLPLAAAGVAAFRMASDLAEATNKVNVVFGRSAQAIEEFASSAAENLGLSTAAALEAAGTFGNLFRAMDIGEERSAALSTELVQLGADLASFNNTTVDDALLALRSGLVGEIEPLRRFGVNLSAARVEQEALRLGLISAGEEMNAAARAQAAYSIIMEDTALAQGDFARTADGAANSMRTFTARLSDVGAELGTVLLPYGQQLLDWAQTAIDRFEELSPTTKKWAVAIAVVAAAAGPLMFILGGLASAIAAVASPVGAVVLALGFAAAEIIALYNSSETFRSGVDAVVSTLREFAGLVGDMFADLDLSPLIDGFKALDESLQPLGGLVPVLLGIFVAVVLIANPVLALAAGFIYLYTNVEGFRRAVDVAVQAVVILVGWLARVISIPINGLSAAFTSVRFAVDLVSGAVSTAVGWMTSFARVSLGPVTSALGRVRGVLDSIVSAARSAADILRNLPIPDIPGFASGGYPSAGVALVGEQGPELVRFGGGERVFSNSATRSLLSGAGRQRAQSAGNTFNVTVNAGSGDGDEIARKVMREIRKLERGVAA